MELRYIAVGFLRFAVVLLLLLGTNRLCGAMAQPIQLIIAALLSAVHSWACFQSGFSFLSNGLWRSVFLLLTAWIAFGWDIKGLKCWAVFTLLMLALQGITADFERIDPVPVLLGVGGLCIICILGFGGRPSAGTCVPVELSYQDKSVRVLALRDTGNFLKDPITGQSVLVVDGAVAQQLTGLTCEQLRSPVEVLSQKTLPGLRLIPYRALGNDNGLLLALRLPRVRIGSWQGSSLVAFAPGTFTAGRTYQALAGGY